MILVRGPAGTPYSMDDASFAASVRARQIPAEALASTDGGATWRPAWQIAGAPPPADDQIAAAFVPIGVAGWAMAAGYWALLVLIFGGLSELAMIAVAGQRDARGGVIVASLAALVLGAGPCALFGWLGQRSIAKNPGKRGMGRVGFAYVVAGLVGLGALVAIVRAALS
jgi:hypothetical protein